MSGLGDLWTNIQTNVQQSISDAQNVGLPALEAQVENKGIVVLTQMQQSAQQTAQAGVTDILNRPSDPNSFMSQLFKNTFQSPALNHYSAYILGGALAVGVGTYLIFARK